MSTPMLHLQPPPPETRPPEFGGAKSPADWIKRNLFNSWYNSLLTVVLAPLLGYLVYRALRFVFVASDWTIIEVNLTNLMVGTFPRDELWRIWVAVGVVALVIGLGVGFASRSSQESAATRGETIATSWWDNLRRLMPLLLMVAGVVVFVRTITPVILLALVVAIGAGGFVAGKRLPRRSVGWLVLAVVAALVIGYVVLTQFSGVPARLWGGFMLNLVLAIAAITMSYPLGVLLALGRRSSLPGIRTVCVAYIEIFRALPLIALLSMGWLILPFFLPADLPTIDKTWRALIIFILFTAAYIAEIVRGGLQSIPKGQHEAAYALGLPAWKINRLVILPQALRNVIPATVGQFISLFKDTSLLLIIGSLDMLGVAQAITGQEAFLAQGLFAQALGFTAFLFWMGSYWMSRESQRLERRLGLGER